jgi:hypothetical protein
MYKVVRSAKINGMHDRQVDHIPPVMNDPGMHGMPYQLSVYSIKDASGSREPYVFVLEPLMRPSKCSVPELII